MFFKKKYKEKLFSPCSGKLINLSDVADEVFSKKIMGDGYAVLPNEKTIYSPVRGKVTTIFPTKHAVGITTDHGIEVLLHVGIDTVELKGTPFDVHINEGQLVDTQTKLLDVDLALLEKKEKDSVIIVLLTNSEKIKRLILSDKKNVNAGNEIGIVEVK